MRGGVIRGSMTMSSRRLREVMVPRTEVHFLHGTVPAKLAVDEVLEAPHSRYPVIGTSADDIIGFVHIRDLLNPRVSSSTTTVADLARRIRALSDSVPVLHALRELRGTASHLAVVTDEYGGTAGIVTIKDLVERLVGDISDEYDTTEEHEVDVSGASGVDGLATP